ncbi:CapA family protein [Streptococcus sp. zg-JUN1979]|uniref:CapA family protein n=1 Tax=Streptococcus sp. zg-JUN1979 TaxID=3391450 RepID=UPI0039A59889
MKYKWTTVLALASLLVLLAIGAFRDMTASKELSKASHHDTKTARVVANGDILIHNVLYASAQKNDGSYDFRPYFKYIKTWIEEADLALGDYEGTIRQDYPLGGYPLFNAPEDIAYTLRDVGYDVIDLAHNHILDSGLDGALNTAQLFQELGLDTIGIYATDRQSEPILIKDVNGIKIAILGYAYGYNGMEANLTQEEYNKHLSDLDEAKMEEEIKKAERLADVTIVMPQMGVEYQLEPTDDQVTLYHKMIDWGADVIFGGHPHVVEPAETVMKDGDKKFIIYSMGNFLSNQRLETVDNSWTERGLLMDITFKKTGQKTVIETVKAHPTMVWAWSKGSVGSEGYDLYNYRTLVLEDFIEGGKYRNELDDTMKERVDTAYQEMVEHVNLKW